jgi:hypothetical protein
MQDEIFLKKHEIFEKKLMSMLLAGEQELFVKLRKQYEIIKVKEREFDGYGFFTNFEVCDKSLAIDGKNFTISDVQIDYDGQILAYGAILFIEKGFINVLDGTPFIGHNWIEDYDKVNDMYYQGKTLDDKLYKRDVSQLEEIGQNIPAEYLYKQ